MRQYLQETVPAISRIRKIPGEASTRAFFRFHTPDLPADSTQIAMVYPERNPEEIRRIERFTATYFAYGIKVPRIERVIGDRIMVLEDLGSRSLQQVFRQSNIKIRKKLLDRIAEILHALRQIPLDKTEIVLDRKRMQFEMDFFLTHFIADSLAGDRKSQLVERLEKLILAIDENSVFCHRDFHSRNMQVVDDRVCLVDFQDSLKGPAYYDLVSIVNDSYLDIGKLKSYLLDALSERGIDIDEKLYHLTALQRNIKALGTFGFQINSRKNRTYIKYIARTLSHIEKNPESTELFSLIRSAEPNHLL